MHTNECRIGLSQSRWAFHINYVPLYVASALASKYLVSDLKQDFPAGCWQVPPCCLKLQCFQCLLQLLHLQYCQGILLQNAYQVSCMRSAHDNQGCWAHVLLFAFSAAGLSLSIDEASDTSSLSDPSSVRTAAWKTGLLFCEGPWPFFLFCEDTTCEDITNVRLQEQTAKEKKRTEINRTDQRPNQS